MAPFSKRLRYQGYSDTLRTDGPDALLSSIRHNPDNTAFEFLADLMNGVDKRYGVRIKGKRGRKGDSGSKAAKTIQTINDTLSDEPDIKTEALYQEIMDRLGENGYYDSFNARFRDELLNGEIFYSLNEAQALIEKWRQHYNTKRPHSALGYRLPAPETIIEMEQRPAMH